MRAVPAGLGWKNGRGCVCEWEGINVVPSLGFSGLLFFLSWPGEAWILIGGWSRPYPEVSTLWHVLDPPLQVPRPLVSGVRSGPPPRVGAWYPAPLHPLSRPPEAHPHPNDGPRRRGSGGVATGFGPDGGGGRGPRAARWVGTSSFNLRPAYPPHPQVSATVPPGSGLTIRVRPPVPASRDPTGNRRTQSRLQSITDAPGVDPSR